MESVAINELDYDIDLDETSKVSVDPWTGRLEGQGQHDTLPTSDPDRTSRVVVDPWTGQLLVEPIRNAASFLETLDGPPMAGPVRLDLRTAAVVVAASLCFGAVIGSIVAVIAFA